MTSLLDQFARPDLGFQAQTPGELFAIRLAQKIRDAEAARHYVALLNDFSEGQLLSAYRRALRASPNGDLSRRFHDELGRVSANGHRDHQANLIAIRVERRTIAAAAFRGGQLDYTDSRQLSSTHDKAVASAVGFINWLTTHLPVDSAALETIPHGDKIQRRVLRDAICAALRQRLIPIWEVPRQTLLESCARPPLKSRAQLRKVATTIWPILAGTKARLFIQDAAILGLHVQTERLFIINQP